MVCALAAAMTGAQGTTEEWPTYAIADAPAGLRPAIQRGDRLVTSLQSTLMSQLQRELDAKGPGGAMKACHLDVTWAAYRLARHEDLAAGRTSARPRSPTNAPKGWAKRIVQQYENAPARGLDGFVVDLGDRIGLLRPIEELAICASCHGPENRLSPSVKAQLAECYPADCATGFKDGDVRGWFWVEVPKR
jgi:hypothetical protein